MGERKGQEKGKMTVEEAGHIGGERTSETHGREFYEGIGHKGRRENVRDPRERVLSADRPQGRAESQGTDREGRRQGGERALARR